MTRKTSTYWTKFWRTPCAYNSMHKLSWHLEAQDRLTRLAKELGLSDRSYEIRSNMGGAAVSGEVTLHGEELYVQVSQSSMGPSRAILIRQCEGRKDYCGGHNNFTHIDHLENIPELARMCNHVMRKWEIAA